MDRTHPLTAEFIQQIPTRLTLDLIRDGLHFRTAISIEWQKRASIKINTADGSSVRSQKDGLLLECPFNDVAIRSVCERCDRYERSTGKVCLNQVHTVFWRSRDTAHREPYSFGKC